MVVMIEQFQPQGYKLQLIEVEYIMRRYELYLFEFIIALKKVKAFECSQINILDRLSYVLKEISSENLFRRNLLTI